MPTLKNGRVPKYRLYKRTGQAVVTIEGRDHYLGTYGSSESRSLYDRLIVEWLARGRRSEVTDVEKPLITVNEVIVAFWDHAEKHYRKPDGTPTSEIDTYRQLIRPLSALYGETPAAQFGPLKLKAVRQRMIEIGWSRSHINKQCSRVKTIFRWAAEEEMVGGDLFHALRAVKGLQRGRTEAPESEPVRPVPDHMIAAIKPYVSRQVWALIQLQLLTGARAGELVKLRPIDIDTNGNVWVAKLTDHKTAHHGHDRAIYLGPKAQEQIKQFLTQDRQVTAYLFSPKDAEAERRDRIHANRKTPMTCGNRPGTHRKENPQKIPGDFYDVSSYRRSIQRACDEAFPLPDELQRIQIRGLEGVDGRSQPRLETDTEWQRRLGPEKWDQVRQWRRDHRWHPHQLRHNAATRIRRERGIDAARAVLGHRSLAITDVYAEIDKGLALTVATETG